MEIKIKLTSAEISKRFRERHPEKVKETQKKWREKNKDKLKEKNKITNSNRDKDKHNEYMKEWRKKKPYNSKNADLKKCYGITIDDYNKKLEHQDYKCAICNMPQGKRALAVDHNHSTGQVRDLLCHKCNTSIGLMDENIDKIKSLISYLEKWNI